MISDDGVYFEMFRDACLEVKGNPRRGTGGTALPSVDHPASIEEREIASWYDRAERQGVGQYRGVGRRLENFLVYLVGGLSHLCHANHLVLNEAIFDAPGTLRFCGTMHEWENPTRGCTH